MTHKYYPFRSKFEESIANDLIDREIDFKYELNTYKFYVKVRKGICLECNLRKAYQEREYTPDFFIGNIIVEAKGNFTSRDRREMSAFVKAYPLLDIRMIFQRNNKISKKSKTRYSDWCEARDIPYAFKTIPDDWIK